MHNCRYSSSSSHATVTTTTRRATPSSRERSPIARRPRESREQMRQLASRVQAAREDERAALARELHDARSDADSVKLESGARRRVLRAEKITAHAVDRLQSLVGLIDIGIEMVRRICTELRPPALDHLGLPEAIRLEAMAFRFAHRLRCHVRADKEATLPTKDQQTGALPDLQSALTNIVRHDVEPARCARMPLSARVSSRCESWITAVGSPRSRSSSAVASACSACASERHRQAGTFEIVGTRGRGTAHHGCVPLSAPSTRPANAATHRGPQKRSR